MRDDGRVQLSVLSLLSRELSLTSAVSCSARPANILLSVLSLLSRELSFEHNKVVIEELRTFSALSVEP